MNTLSKYTTNSRVVVLLTMCTINTKWNVFLCLLDGSLSWTVCLFLWIQAYIIIPKMLHCTVCVGVSRAVWVHGIDFCITKGTARILTLKSKLDGYWTNPEIFPLLCCRVYSCLWAYISKEVNGQMKKWWSHIFCTPLNWQLLKPLCYRCYRLC